MPELTDLQAELLKVLEKHSKVEELFNARVCKLTSEEIVEKMKIKPSSESYISRLLGYLKNKGKIKYYRKQVEGEGLVRIIEIL